mgnify:CR=1 FL=1
MRTGTRLAIAEMISAERRLRDTRLSRLRTAGNTAGMPRWVQIAGMPKARGPYNLVTDPQGGLPTLAPVTP